VLGPSCSPRHLFACTPLSASWAAVPWRSGRKVAGSGGSILGGAPCLVLLRGAAAWLLPDRSCTLTQGRLVRKCYARSPDRDLCRQVPRSPDRELRRATLPERSLWQTMLPERSCALMLPDRGGAKMHPDRCGAPMLPDRSGARDSPKGVAPECSPIGAAPRAPEELRQNAP